MCIELYKELQFKLIKLRKQVICYFLINATKPILPFSCSLRTKNLPVWALFFEHVSMLISMSQFC